MKTTSALPNTIWCSVIIGNIKYRMFYWVGNFNEMIPVYFQQIYKGESNE